MNTIGTIKQGHHEILTEDPRFQFFPREFVELRLEIGKHKSLEADLKGINELPVWYATVATYCGIAVDGGFTPEDLRNLTVKLTYKLQAIRYRQDFSVIVPGTKAVN